jgi:hypothetical protein
VDVLVDIVPMLRPAGCVIDGARSNNDAPID